MSRGRHARKPSIRIAACAALLIASWAPVAPTSAAETADWPSFRGARGDGVSAETGVFGAGGVRLEVAWKRMLGKGYSGVSVADGRVVTMFSDWESDVVVGLNVADGRERWRYAVAETYRGHDGSQDGPIATPVIAEGRVFALGPRGQLVAIDADTGREIWKTDLVKDHGAVKPHWGFGTSPIVAAGVLVVEVGAKEAMVCGFDTKTGRRLWAAGDDEVYYQSPVPLARDGGSELLIAGNKKLFCIDAKSGDVRWQYAHDGGGEYGSICMVPVPLDGGRVFLDHKDDRAVMLEIAGDGGPAAIKPLWEEPCTAKSYVAPVRLGDFIFGYNGRTPTCIAAKTGKPAWRSRQPGDGFPIIVDGHLAILTKDGSLHVSRATPDRYDEIAAVKVFSDLVWTPPSFARGSFFVRSFGEIARVDVRRGAAPALARRESEPDIAGTRFAQLLGQLRDADDKPAAIDRFLASVDQFPMIEPDGRVVFVYRGPGEDVAIGGDIAGFGNKPRMERVPATDLFYFVARLEPDARLSYAFIRDFKATPDPLNPRKTSVTGYDDEMELDFGDARREVSWFAMPRWQPPTHLDEPDESRRGRIESHTFKSTALDAEVAVDVYLPADYEKTSGRLPVAYIHSGRMARDELRIPTTLDNLIGRRVEPVIAVFINRDPPFFSFDAYAKMCAEELPAFIDERYRTVRSPDGRAHVAWSFSAGAALHTVLAHPTAGKLGIQSPFIIQLEPFDPFMKEASERPLTVYFDWGKYDVRSPLECWSASKAGRKLDEYFRDRGYRPVGGEAHDGAGVASWQNRMDDLFEALFPVRPPKL